MHKKKRFREEDLDKPLTRRDMKYLATKEDLKQFATKKDLEQFATKEDLRGYATNQALLSLKRELKSDIRALDVRVTVLQLDMTDVKKDVREIKNDIQEKFDTLITGQDKIFKILGIHEEERVFSANRSDRLDRTVIAHEKRISVLEKKRG